eukprot:11532804-Karenia_brevis.AAC.1
MGSLHEWHAHAQVTYASCSAATNKEKSGRRQLEATRLGIHVNGVNGMLSLNGDKLNKVVGLTCYLLDQDKVSLKDLQ